MPAGDLITADFQFEIRTTLYGRTTSVLIDDPGVGGIGNPDAKTQDVDLPGRDGVYANPDYQQMRAVTIPVLLTSAPLSASTVMTTLKALMASWVVSTSDIPLVIQLPGFGKFKVLGRPRSLKPNLTQMSGGLITADLRFDCPDPTITYL